MDLIVVIPSLGRPGQAAALVDSIAHTAQASTFCVVAVDADDPTLGAYQEAMRGRGNAIVHVVAEPAGHVGAINAGALAALDLAPEVKALAKFDDDHMPKHHAFDATFLDALEHMGGGIVYGDDLYQGRALPTAPIISAPIVKALGWMALPSLRHMFCDNAWLVLGEAAGCIRYLPQVHIEHRHFLNFKAPEDATYQLSNTSERYAVDGAAFHTWVEDGLASDAATVRTALGKE